MTTTTRLAIVAGLLLASGALAATLLPAEPFPGAECGTWVAPEWDEETAQELIDEVRGTYERAERLGQDEIAGEALALARDFRRLEEECGAALSTRRTVTLSLAGLAVTVPAAVLFVARGRRRDDQSAPHRTVTT